MAFHSGMHQKPKLFAVIHEQDSKSFISNLERLCCVGWEKYVSVKVRKPRDRDIERFTHELIEEFLDASAEIIFFQPGLIQEDELEEEGIYKRPCKTTKTMIQAMSEYLKRLRLHWLTFAEQEMEKSLLRSAKPDAWVQQFTEIGHKDVGINLLKCLRVISNSEIKESFRINSGDEIGVKIAHAYVHENEPGSSSIAVKNILEHMHPEGNVIALDLSKTDPFDELDCDVLYVYEDGLWSGVEIVKRLRAICELESFKKSRLQIIFKYCVTCDAGLSAARIYTLNEATGRFLFPSANKNCHFTFFKTGTDSRFSDITERTTDSIRTAIDAAISPFAFSSESIWRESRDAAIHICSEIGGQLVTAYFEKKHRKNDNEPMLTATGLSEKVSRLRLGAMGFASTIVFDSSIPKPVLPIMWLNGKVTIGDKTVDWRPLFWDARRTGSLEHQ
ncbi:hypothetical protein [Pseudomonas aeruginosa]|uniref:phosphoribosyltransferase-like protein n=1 Tax=Pseudomonas aeruginosa TaxID=287 RepID=UPI002E2D6650|nr:hypothetical protein [Pseudomonas aeruginosa]